MLRKDFEEERLELLVAAVDLIDEQHGLARGADRAQQRALEEKRLTEDLRFALADRLSRAFTELDVQQLLRVIPFVQRRAGVEALVALQAYQLGVENSGEHLGDFSFPNARRIFDEERFVQGHREVGRGGGRAIRDVALCRHRLLQARDRFLHVADSARRRR
jgi:hypothetical protein